ncbi:glycosyltransferase family 4 protein [Microbacterium sp. cx-59]|uniref:glycosyltransferase family 4 protein n=1 Tax=Microbacterium sp. cx-59 TaxID=2891207 RepID=UPI001E63FBD2|nr:glycosyltransferase family 4 protein [Microbacterium sp. cx-59]MCC4908096.1 glycosyltransferase family 4 protein [Microbacterium sp. cx-59]
METVLRAYGDSHWPSFDMNVVASSKRGSLSTRLRTVASALLSVRRSRADQIHFHLSHRGSFVREGLLVLMTNGKPLFATIHGSDFVRSAGDSALWRTLYKLVLSRMSSVAVLNDDALASVNQLVPRVPAMILPNPGPIDPAPPAPTYTSGMSVVFAGRVGHRKGVDTLLRAWDLVQAQQPSAELIIAGPLDADLADEELGALSRHHVGPLSPAEVQDRLQFAACATLPSRAEGQPMFLIEALAFGVPLVVSDVGGMPGLAEGAGSVVPVGDHVRLADAIVTILNGGDRVDELRRSASKKYQDQFSADAHDAGLRQLYTLHPARSTDLKGTGL